MPQQEFCKSCNQKHDCRESYRRLGSVKGPSVVFKAVVAFLLPMAVFIVALAASEKILAGIITTKGLQTALGFVLALSVTIVLVLCCSTRCRR